MKYIVLVVLFSYFLLANSVNGAIEVNEPDIINKSFSNCNQVLQNHTFKSCYNYEFKGVTASLAEIRGKNVNLINITKRPQFYEDKNIPEQHRTQSSDWTNTGHDRGHIESDASNDYSEEVLKLTYTMSNITLQKPITNRQSYLEVEKRERELAVLYNKIYTFTVINYSNDIINNIRVPSEYIKMFFDSEYKPLECYKIKNDNIRYELHESKIGCSLL